LICFPVVGSVSHQIVGHWCFVLRPEVTKGKRLRRIPIHKHLRDQGFLEYVEERRKIGKPLFYEPRRARGGRGANPQWHKVAERLGEWVRESLKVTDVQPNHGWRHLWREIVRGTRMKPELCDYMCGHESKSGTSARYGKRKVPVLAKEMSLFPLLALRTDGMQTRRNGYRTNPRERRCPSIEDRNVTWGGSNPRSRHEKASDDAGRAATP
jgi:integrase